MAFDIQFHGTLPNVFDSVKCIQIGHIIIKRTTDHKNHIEMYIAIETIHMNKSPHYIYAMNVN